MTYHKTNQVLKAPSYVRGCVIPITVSYRPFTFRHISYLHNFPRVLLNSALCKLGYWSPKRLLAAWAHTMNAFIGRLTCVLRFSNLKNLTQITSNFLKSRSLIHIIDLTTCHPRALFNAIAFQHFLGLYVLLLK